MLMDSGNNFNLLDFLKKDFEKNSQSIFKEPDMYGELKHIQFNSKYDFWHDLNENGTINAKSLPPYLRPTNFDQRLSNFHNNHKVIEILLYILSAIFFILLNWLLGICYSLLAIYSYKNGEKIRQSRILINDGINYFNNKEYEKSIEIFTQAKNLVPKFIKQKYNRGLNSWIEIALEKLEKNEEALAFLENNYVKAKRIKKFNLLVKLKRYREAIAYFNDVVTEKELIKHPSLVAQPINVYIVFLKDPQAGLNYLMTQKNILSRPIENEEYCIFYCCMALCYLTLKDEDNYQKTISLIKNYNPKYVDLVFKLS